MNTQEIFDIVKSESATHMAANTILHLMNGVPREHIKLAIHDAGCDVIIANHKEPYQDLDAVVRDFAYKALQIAGHRVNAYRREHGLKRVYRSSESICVEDWPQAFIEQLPPAAREVVLMRLRGMEYRAISKRLNKHWTYAGSSLQGVKKRWKYFQRPENKYDSAFAETITDPLHLFIYERKTHFFEDPQTILKAIKFTPFINTRAIKFNREYVAQILYNLKKKYHIFLEPLKKDGLKQLRKDLKKEKLYESRHYPGWDSYEAPLSGREFPSSAVVDLGSY
jgi:hypothetical protein